jgi:predicted phosphodiesterase
MRVAVIADVHGNAVALEAALAHIGQCAPDAIVNLGDLFSGPFDPARSAQIQIALECSTIAGNHERQLLQSATGFSDAFARTQLSPEHLDWIAALPRHSSWPMGRSLHAMAVPRAETLSIFWRT